MNAFYRFLGVVARVNQSLSEQWINGLSLSWVIILATAIALIVSLAVLGTTGDVTVWVPVAGLAALMLALLGQSLYRRNIVFRPVPAESIPDSTPALPRDIGLRFSGRLALDEEERSWWGRWRDTVLYGTPKSRWFLNVPAVFGVIEGGEPAFVSYLDPSLRLFGVVRLDNRAGAWVTLVRRGSVQEPECGRMYLGLHTQPAARIRYTEPGGKRRVAVVSFADEVGRAAFLAQLGDATSVSLSSQV